jgi:single-stranded DNA-binding protein
MANLCRAFLIGKVTDMKELKYLNDSVGSPFVLFHLVCRSERESDGGVLRTSKAFVAVAAYGGMAIDCSQKMSVGDVVYVEGNLVTHNRMVGEVKRRDLTVHANRIQYLYSVPKLGAVDESPAVAEAVE